MIVSASSEIAAARLNGFATVHDRAADTAAREFVGAEQPRGPISDDDDSAKTIHIDGMGRAQLLQLRVQLEEEPEHDPTASRVDGPFAEREPDEVDWAHADPTCSFSAYGLVVVVVVEPEFDLDFGRQHGHPQHFIGGDAEEAVS